MTYRKLLVCAVAAIGLVSIPLRATASARLTDKEVKELLEGIENKRSAFEGALDDKLKNSTIKSEKGEVNTNEFFDDFQDQVQRARERFESNYSASSEVLSLLQFATRLDGWASFDRHTMARWPPIRLSRPRAVRLRSSRSME